MKLDKIINVPEARIIFVKDDVDAIEDAARRHYDARCQTETLGIVKMLRHQLTHSKTAELVFTQTQVDLMAKACERGKQGPDSLLAQFIKILSDMNEAFNHNNPR